MYTTKQLTLLRLWGWLCWAMRLFNRYEFNSYRRR
jgi:hypothetical protein